MFSRKQRSKSGSAVTHSRSSLADLVGDAKKSRGFSLPTDWRRSRIKGIMKYLTHDESVHSTYGSERGAEPDEPEKAQTVAPMSPGEAAVRRKIKFADILIREYDRTIGDNPSCSSGRKTFNQMCDCGSLAVLVRSSYTFFFPLCQRTTTCPPIPLTSQPPSGSLQARFGVLVYCP